VSVDHALPLLKDQKTNKYIPVCINKVAGHLTKFTEQFNTKCCSLFLRNTMFDAYDTKSTKGPCICFIFIELQTNTQ